MKFAVGPRAIGKTTLIIDQILKIKKGKVIVLTPAGQRDFFMKALVYMCETLKVSYAKFEKDHHLVFVNKEVKVMIRSTGTYNNASFHRVRPDFVFIDNIDMVLHNIFGKIDLATGTGPNLAWPKSNQMVYESVLKHIEVNNIAENKDDFQMEWEL